MIFTTKAEYGVRLLVELGRQGSGQPVSLKAISEAEGLPLAYLERIVALLKKANLVDSQRGMHGRCGGQRGEALCLRGELAGHAG